MNKQNLLEKFVDSHFDSVDKKRFPEVRVDCPVCNGGVNNDPYTFNMNLEKGVCRCWRASCDWRGTVESLVMKVYDVDFEKAKDILYGEFESNIDKAKFVLNNISFDDLDNYSFLNNFHGMPEGVELVHKYNVTRDIVNWIENDRGYDIESFLDNFDFYYPPLGTSKFEGRLMFSVKTMNRLSYIAYGYKDVFPKTLNPKGKTLSRMLFNYESVRSLGGDYVFICEGIFDTCRLKSFGLNAVSIFGVNASDVQYELLSSLNCDEYILCFDNGAKEEMYKFLKEFNEYVNNTYISIVDINRKDYIGDNFKEGMDPDDLEYEEFSEFYKNRKIFKKSSLSNVKNKIKKIEEKYV